MKRVRSLKKAIALLVLTVVVLACAGTDTTSQPTVSPAAAATPEATTAVVEDLPGFRWDDLTGNLDNIDFECQSFGEGVHVYGCERIEPDGMLSAGAYGTGPGSIHTVTATAEGAASEEFIGFIATLPYDGAQPDAARAWAKQNFGSSSTTMFGVAHFSLSTEDGATTLIISTLED